RGCARETTNHWRLPCAETLVGGFKFINRAHHLSHHVLSFLLFLRRVQNGVSDASSVLDVVVVTLMQVEQHVRVNVTHERPKIAREPTTRWCLLEWEIPVEI